MKTFDLAKLFVFLAFCIACKPDRAALNDFSTPSQIPRTTDKLASTAQTSPIIEKIEPSLQILPPSDILPCPQFHTGFYYLFENALFQFSECQSTLWIEEVASSGVNIEDVLLFEEKLFVLTEKNLAVWDLSSKRGEIVYEFQEEIQWGGFAPGTDSGKVFFFNTLEALPHNIREVYAYDIVTGTSQLLVTYPRGVHLIGYDESSELLYVVPFGQDPEIREVHAIPIDGDDPSVLPVEGFGYVAQSDNGQWLATAAQKFVALDEPLLPALNVYHVSGGQVSLYSSYSLPLNNVNNSGVSSLVWSAAPESFMFLINPTDPYAGATTADFILGSYKPEGDVISTLLSITGEDLAILSVEPTSGNILLLDRTSGPYYYVDTSGKYVYELDLPYYVLFAGWSE
ncbi:MAG: hypothetical protein DWQ07_01445 [Chloroflexi bacterium]|nr:MAG: hypothetical protein DWQ07_01445 [Chloroflexota bacterium]MBL1193839.1 hypothetical protein [Chloroflexota bacterium]NOH11133.1 hypothetical protein [Chloroflexota bacterium]